MSDGLNPTNRLARLADSTFTLIDRVIGSRCRWHHIGTGRSITVSWLVTRAAMLALLWYFEFPVINDLNYYFNNLHAASVLGPAYAVPEYPLPVAAILAIPYVLGFANRWAYQAIFILMMLGIDAAFTRILFVQQARRFSPVLTVWLAAGLLIGPLMVTRFDLIPGVLVALSALWLAQTPVRSGFALAIGTGIKVWPALMVPAFAAAKRTRIQLLASAFITSAVLISASIWIGGWARFISPLRYQSDRGLQVEAPISLPLMLAWAFRPGKWTVYYSDTSKSVEVGGPGANILLAVAGILTLLALALIAVLTLRAWRMGSTITADTIALIIVSAIGLIIMSNKVFSPQYLLWITPSVAVALALDSWKDAGDEKAAAPTDQGLQRITILLLAVAALTQLIYPRCYDWVSQLNPLNPLGVTMLAVRDIALAIVVYSFCRRAWAATCLDQV